jgi:two-component system phosphate regulon sensor histidine kinase PhoR
MLDVTRLRMGQTVELDLGPADLVKIAGRLASEYQNMSPRHAIVLETELTRLLGDWDEARIERVVSNLLSNSVKYSPHGGEIRVGAAREEREGGDWAVLTVKDWGLGIPESELGRVFEPYYRGSNVASTTSGTGVGLAGTRHIVEQHGGVIEVESTPNDATVFTVHLPLLRDEDEFGDE